MSDYKMVVCMSLTLINKLNRIKYLQNRCYKEITVCNLKLFLTIKII